MKPLKTSEGLKRPCDTLHALALSAAGQVPLSSPCGSHTRSSSWRCGSTPARSSAHERETVLDAAVEAAQAKRSAAWAAQAKWSASGAERAELSASGAVRAELSASGAEQAKWSASGAEQAKWSASGAEQAHETAAAD